MERLRLTYTRVVPRDLFNEGDLLNCLGRLWIKLDDRRDHRAVLEFTGNRFEVEQDPSDGSISCTNFRLSVDPSVETVPLFRPLNSRSKWPLWARFGDEDRRVFDLDGELSPEFWIEIAK